MASGLKSDNSNLVLNADGAGNKVVIQENGIDQELMKRLPTAWVNFDGTTGAIRDSYNINSIVVNSIGNTTINFNTPMDNTNYVCNVTQNGEPTVAYGHVGYFNPTISGVDIATMNINGEGTNRTLVSVTVFGGKN